MNKRVLVVAGGILGLAGCQTSPTYTQYMAGPPLEYAQAKCNMLAPSVHTGYVAIGSPAFVAGAALGNAIGNAIAEAEFRKNCMALQGWRQDPPGAQKEQPAPQAARVQGPAKRRGPPTQAELGIPSRVVAGQ